jgi:hypothetical protein
MTNTLVYLSSKLGKSFSHDLVSPVTEIIDKFSHCRELITLKQMIVGANQLFLIFGLELGLWWGVTGHLVKAKNLRSN